MSHCGRTVRSPSFQEGSLGPSRNEKGESQASMPDRSTSLLHTVTTHRVTMTLFFFPAGLDGLAPAWPSLCYGTPSPAPPQHMGTCIRTLCPRGPRQRLASTCGWAQLVWHTKTHLATYVNTGTLHRAVCASVPGATTVRTFTNRCDTRTGDMRTSGCTRSQVGTEVSAWN